MKDRILYRDNVCIVVNKRSGESTEPLTPISGGGAKGTMIDLPSLITDFLKSENPAFAGTVYPVNRIDVPVTGCALFAFDDAALSALNEEFAAGRVKKIYWAITHLTSRGVPSIPKSGALVHWLAGEKNTNKVRAFNEDGPGRQRAELRYRIAGRGERYLFWEIELVSGRRHQIRAQLAKIGCPVKGDLKYGASRSEKSGGIRLHARSLVCGAIHAECLPPETDNLWQAAAENFGKRFNHEKQIASSCGCSSA